jgi:pimeloyl-ACP methyl ester carboxylesterase
VEARRSRVPRSGIASDAEDALDLGGTARRLRSGPEPTHGNDTRVKIGSRQLSRNSPRQSDHDVHRRSVCWHSANATPPGPGTRMPGMLNVARIIRRSPADHHLSHPTRGRCVITEEHGSPQHPRSDESGDCPDALEPVKIWTGSAWLGYCRGGSRGQPVVLLNALGQGLEPWSRLIERLLPRRLLIWKTRGIDPPHRALPLEEHVDDIAAIIAAEGIDACHLVGWCTGPKMALRYHHRRPDSVRSMVFLNPAFKHPSRLAELDTPYERNLEVLCRAVDRRPETAERLRNLLWSDAFGAPADARDRNAGGAPARAPSDTVVRRPFRSGSALVSYARQHLDFWAHDPTPDASAVRVPVLFVAAEQDDIVSPRSVWLAAEIFPIAHYTEIAGATHHALSENADLVAGLIEGFVLHAEHPTLTGLPREPLA